MKNKEILDVSSDVKWIGILDKDLATFDVVMETKFGTTYNSYFINADKKTIIETSKEKFWDVYLNKIKQVCVPEEIDYIIANHTEPDHSGNIANLIKIAPKAKVVATGNAIRYLKDLIGFDFPHIIVRDGDTLDLGNKTLSFIGAPNLHWPDSMFTYLHEDKLLFTCDAFGAHYCDEEMYNDKIGNYDEAFKYYFDVILKPYSKFILKAVDKIKDLQIDCICPGHGPILRSNPLKIVEKSVDFAKEALKMPERKVIFIPYVSAYDKTGKVAHKIADGIKSTANVDVEVADIEMMSLGDLDERISRSSAYIIGSPTINQNTLLPIYKLFALINPIRDRNKLAAAFGSYGWSGEAPCIIEANIKSLKLRLFEEKFTFKFTPHDNVQQNAINFGKKFAEHFTSLLNTEEIEN
ncbi:MAG: FprA family A-type flavoprotein [Bacteroidales bacterium]|nr:FprA family A-type flavoprotein [Bacteroidales bacterium]